MYVKAQLLRNRRAHVKWAPQIALKIAKNSVINPDHNNYSRTSLMKGKYRQESAHMQKYMNENSDL